ncbi:MAG: hypothetical protein JNM26_04335, partial [Ideonella sp.]|nr:hypothetical protein [Ideonella sp.]
MRVVLLRRLGRLRPPAHHEGRGGSRGRQRHHRRPPGRGQQEAAQRGTGGHAGEHADEQHRIEAAAGAGVDAVDECLVRHQRGLHAEVETDRPD